MTKREKDLSDKIAFLDDEIKVLSRERDAAHRELMELRSQFKIGDVIEWLRGSRIASGRVVAVYDWCGGEPAWQVRRIKKDGSEGKLVVIQPYLRPKLSSPVGGTEDAQP